MTESRRLRELQATRGRLGFLNATQQEIFSKKQIDFLEKIDFGISSIENICPTRSLHLILKATRLCNLRCSYCNAWREGPGNVLSFEDMARVISQAMNLNGLRNVHFVWHGGETTLLSQRYFEQALWLQEHFRVDDRNTQHAIQTNATLIDESWIEFFAATGFSVGVSIDLNQDQHDKHRVFKGGAGSFAATVNGLSLLKAHKIPHGILAVVNDEVLARGPEALLNDLERLDVGSIGLLNALPPNVFGQSGPDYLPFSRFVIFLTELYRLWKANYSGKFVLRELASLEGIVAGSRSRLCLFQGDCMGQYLTIEPDGKVSACDKYVGDSDYLLGDLHHESLSDILRPNAQLARAQREAQSYRQSYRDCRHFQICQGGCPHDNRLNTRNGAAGGCCGLFELVEEMKKAKEECYG